MTAAICVTLSISLSSHRAIRKTFSAFSADCKQEHFLTILLSSFTNKNTTKLARSASSSAPKSPSFYIFGVRHRHPTTNWCAATTTPTMTGVPSSRSPPWTVPASIERRPPPQPDGFVFGAAAAGFIEVQLSSLCRICAKVGDSMVDIYDQIFAEDYRPALDQWINDYLPIKVSVRGLIGVFWDKSINRESAGVFCFKVTQSDALPLKVCAKCSQILVTFHQLYLCCLDTKQRFEAMLREHPVQTKAVEEDVEEEEEEEVGEQLPNGSSELTMGSIMDGIIVDETDFLHYAEDDHLVCDFYFEINKIKTNLLLVFAVGRG